MDETSVTSPTQDLSSFLAFLRMPLSEGEVEGGLELGHVGLTALVAAGFGGGPYTFHCSLAHTASGLIGLPHFCIIGLLDLLVAVVAPMVLAHLPEVVIPLVSLMMLVMRDLSLSLAIFSSLLTFACSLIFFSMAAATAFSNLAFLDHSYPAQLLLCFAIHRALSFAPS